MSEIKILKTLIPNAFKVSELATLCKIHKTTMIHHLQTNYQEGVDYYKMGKKAKNSKIVIAKATAIQIRIHYAEKN